MATAWEPSHSPLTAAPGCRPRQQPGSSRPERRHQRPAFLALRNTAASTVERGFGGDTVFLADHCVAWLGVWRLRGGPSQRAFVPHQTPPFRTTVALVRRSVSVVQKPSCPGRDAQRAPDLAAPLAHAEPHLRGEPVADSLRPSGVVTCRLQTWADRLSIHYQRRPSHQP